MAYNREYPYTDPNFYNDDWLLSEVKKLGKEMNDLTESLQNQITETIIELLEKGTLTVLNLENIVGKRICIYGDSITSEQDNKFSWVSQLRKMLPTNEILNLASDGSSFCGLNAYGMSFIPSGYDIYILALGVNDYIGQYAFKDLPNNFNVVSSANNVFAGFVAKNKDALFYYISPLKTKLNSSTNVVPLFVYQSFFEHLAIKYGFNVICGYTTPQNSTYNDKLSDGLHPTAAYQEVLGSYYAVQINNSINTFLPYLSENKTISINMNGQNGYVEIHVDSNLQCVYTLIVSGVQVSTGYNVITELHSFYTIGTFVNQNINENMFFAFQNDNLCVYAVSVENIPQRMDSTIAYSKLFN